MSTLLKAHLLKTDDPFIMLKCYLEDILKAQGLTWNDLIDNIIRESEGKTRKHKKLTISPPLLQALEELSNDYPDFVNIDKPTKEGLKPPKLEGRESKKFEDEQGELKTKVIMGDDLMHPHVMEENIRKFIQALKSSPEFQKDAPILKPILDGLEGMLKSYLREEKTPERKIAVREPGKTIEGKTHKVALNDGLEYLADIKKLITRISDDDIIDFEGERIYSAKLMKGVYDLLPTPKHIDSLKKHANGEVIDNLKNLYGFNSADLESIKNNRDKNHRKIMNTLKLTKEEEKSFSDRIRLLEDIRDTLSEEIKYVTLDGEEEKPLHEAIIDVYQSKSNVQLIEDIAEHKNANEIMSNLWKDLKKFGGKELMGKLLKDPNIREKMGLPPTDKQISEKETQRIMEQVEAGEEVTWGN
tara:strand:- start:687 stop:1928 length:1242 start_codon:yes stop_codon:yes gene_type:complete